MKGLIKGTLTPIMGLLQITTPKTAPKIVQQKIQMMTERVQKINPKRNQLKNNKEARKLTQEALKKSYML